MKKYLFIPATLISLASSFQLPLMAEEIQEQPLVNEVNTASSTDDTDNQVKALDQYRTIEVRNELPESVKVIFESSDLNAEIKNLEIYLGAYETKEKISLSKATLYKIKIYNIYNKYLGSLINTDVQKQNSVAVSPFLLVADLPKRINTSSSEPKAPEPAPVEVQPASQQTVTLSVQETKTTTTTESQTVKKIDDKKARYLKISNISDSKLILKLLKPDGSPIGDNWELSNDIYVPQFIKLDDHALQLPPDTVLEVTESNSSKKYTKPITDLNIDEKGNYVWFVK